MKGLLVKPQKELELRNYSRETQKLYNFIVKDFIEISPNISNYDVKRYLLFLLSQ